MKLLECNYYFDFYSFILKMQYGYCLVQENNIFVIGIYLCLILVC
jgi:hypothetical protein